MGASVMAQQKKRMGSMKLSSFAQSSPPPADSDSQPVPTSTREPKQTAMPRSVKLATLNIKVRKDQQRWLQDTAQVVRDNNLQAQLPQERVYPQHLIGVAIDFLMAQDIDWHNIKTADDLRHDLNL